MKIFLTLALLILLPPAAVTAQAQGVKRIQIVSSWGGLGKPERDELVITGKSGGYRANGKKVSGRLVEDLLAAIDEPVIEAPVLANLGITQEWLDANAEKGVREYADFYYSTAAPNLQALYLSHFKDQSFISKLLPHLIRGGWTDDYPSVEVEITGDGGDKILISSGRQQRFMLPWEVKRNGQTLKTYNANISRAVAGLMPKKFTNRERVAGEGLSRVLAGAVLHDIREEWATLDAENKAGKYLGLLRARYSVMAAEVSGHHNADYGKEWVDGNPQQVNLQAALRSSDPPANLTIGVALPYKDGAVDNVELFINSIDRYRNLVLSVPWLREYISSNPDVNFHLRFVGDRSFGEKAMQSFTEDMKLRGKEALAAEVAAVQKDASLLIADHRTWLIILPDRRAVLWRFSLYGGMTKWNDANLEPWNCSYQGKCVGAVISPDGILVSK